MGSITQKGYEIGDCLMPGYALNGQFDEASSANDD